MARKLTSNLQLQEQCMLKDRAKIGIFQWMYVRCVCCYDLVRQIFKGDMSVPVRDVSYWADILYIGTTELIIGTGRNVVLCSINASEGFATWQTVTTIICFKVSR